MMTCVACGRGVRRAMVLSSNPVPATRIKTGSIFAKMLPALPYTINRKTLPNKTRTESKSRITRTSCPKNLTAKQAPAYESIAPTRDIMELMYERGVLTDAEQEFEPHPLQPPNLPGTE